MNYWTDEPFLIEINVKKNKIVTLDMRRAFPNSVQWSFIKETFFR